MKRPLLTVYLCVAFAGCAAVHLLSDAGHLPDSSAAPADVAGDRGHQVDSAGLENVLRVADRIYSGGQPRGAVGFRSLQQLGVKTIVSVDGARPQLELASRHGLRYVHIPIGYDGIPKEAGEMLAHVVRAAEGPYYIHCHHGKHRAPAAAAVASLATGQVTSEQATEILRRGGTSRAYKGLWRDVARYRPPPSDAELPELVQAATVRSLTAAMARIGRHFDNLRSSQDAGWKVPPEHPDLAPDQEALLLYEGLREAGRHRGNRYPSPFREWLAEAEKEASQLLAALRGRNPSQAAQPMDALTRSCQRCHEKFRDE